METSAKKDVERHPTPMEKSEQKNVKRHPTSIVALKKRKRAKDSLPTNKDTRKGNVTAETSRKNNSVREKVSRVNLENQSDKYEIVLPVMKKVKNEGGLKRSIKSHKNKGKYHLVTEGTDVGSLQKKKNVHRQMQVKASKTLTGKLSDDKTKNVMVHTKQTDSSDHSSTNQKPAKRKLVMPTISHKVLKLKKLDSVVKNVTKHKGAKRQEGKVKKNHTKQPKKSPNISETFDNCDNLLKVNPTDPMAMLLMMEDRQGILTAPVMTPSIVPQPGPSKTKSHSTTSTPRLVRQSLSMQIDSESEEMSDWEEVYDHSTPFEKSQLPDKPVEITLEMPDILKNKKRKKKTFDWKSHLERRVKRFKKEVSINMHKVHLLCLLSLGMRQNQVLNDTTLRAVALSLLPQQLTGVSDNKTSTERLVENLLLWYKRTFSLENVRTCSGTRLVTVQSLVQAISDVKILDARIWVLVFICLLRVSGLNVRLILSFQPIPFNVSENSQASDNKIKTSPDPKNKNQTKRIPKSTNLKKKMSFAYQSKSSKTKQVLSRSKSKSKSSQRSIVRATEMMNKSFEENADSGLSEEEGRHGDMVRKKIAALSISLGVDSRKTLSTDNDFEDSSANSSTYSPVSNKLRKDLKVGANKIVLPDSDEGVVQKGFLLSQSTANATGQDLWLEVFFPATNKWICFDCFKAHFGQPYSLEKSATQSLSYVLGFRNDGGVKELTARYAKHWLSHTRKSQVDAEWWTETMMYFDRSSVTENNIEDDEIKGQLLVRPMPTCIAELKNHPLYVLRRHLLKFEAIYPDTAVPIGYIKTEPVYARECVHILHSRNNWLKEGRLVRVKEAPYKMVKSRPKWNKPKENPEALDLELYGEWQTEQYIPPPAFNGKVPKNEYGNVELFKAWMLPLGTVQIRGQGMQRVANKLTIDVAPAMVGWDHHCGYAHPIMDGWVVCEEFADTLLAAWEEDQEIQKQRECEKLEKRVYSNWRMLIRGLLIKEKLQKKFVVVPKSVVHKAQETSSPANVKKDEKPNDTSADNVSGAKHSWPQSSQNQEKEIGKERKGKKTVKRVPKMQQLSRTHKEMKTNCAKKNLKASRSESCPNKNNYEIGVFSKREILENLNISEESEDDDFEDVSPLVTASKTKEKDTTSEMPEGEVKTINDLSKVAQAKDSVVTKSISLKIGVKKQKSSPQNTSDKNVKDRGKRTETSVTKCSSRVGQKQVNYSEVVNEFEEYDHSDREDYQVKEESSSSSEDEISEEVEETVTKPLGRKRSVVAWRKTK